MSNLSLVNDALRLIGVLPEGQDASAEQGEIALRTVTDLVDEWGDDGIIVTWDSNPQLSGECSLNGTELNAVRYALAVKLCPMYGRDPSGSLAMLANNAVNRLVRQQLVRSMEPVTSSLPVSEGTRQYWDAETDS
jgi:hypothetical protein